MHSTAGDTNYSYADATDHVTSAINGNMGKYAVGIVALTNLYALDESIGGEHAGALGEAFRLRLHATLRTDDNLIPLSDDMAALVLDDLMDSNHLHLAALKIERLFETPIDIADSEVQMNVCAGLVYAGRKTRSSKNPAELYQMAEEACSGALMSGKPFTIVNAAEDQPLDSDWQLNQRIHAAMENHHITFDYQPKVDLETGDLAGAEALIRWRDNGQIVPPDDYLAALNDEVLWQLTIYGYRRVLREILDYSIDVPVSFNIDPSSLAQPDFLEFMLRETNLWGVPTAQIVFEITENKELFDLDQSKTLLATIREKGFKVSLDDFGAGHANMHRIRELPLDEIKLDRSLCSNILDDPDACRVTKTIIELANTLNISCVAEGIEDANTMAQLKAFGCDIGQGFYLGAPMFIDDFVKLESGDAETSE